MGNADSKPRKVTVENTNAPIFISDELRDRLSAAAVQSVVKDGESRSAHAERSPDDVTSTVPLIELPAGISSSLPPEKSSASYPASEDRMSLGEETALALLRLKQERDAELDRMQSEYFAKIRKAEEDFAAINNLKEEVYSKAVQETATMFDKPRMAVCGDMEQTVLDCYKSNPANTLNCYTLVSQFHDCVAATRVREALSNKIVLARLRKERKEVLGMGDKIPAGAPRNVTIDTTMGTFSVELYWNHAPMTCKNFAELSKRGYYNGVKFHRIIRDFMIQGGDPTGTGRGGASIFGRTFQDEIHPDLFHSGAGILSMANSGPNTNGSQFFISLAPTQWLDKKHTIFGRISSGMQVVQRIGLVETDNNDCPIDDVKIITATPVY